MTISRSKIVLFLLGLTAWAAVSLGAIGAGAAVSPDPTPVPKKATVQKVPTAEPTSNPNLAPPKVKPVKDIEAEPLPDFTPATLPKIRFPEQATPTPTPEPGLTPRDPSAAALFSVILPGLGHVYSGEPIKGLFFTAAFGVSLYLSLDNFRLHSEPGSSEKVAKNETAGSLYGLGALAAYGFGVQDAFNSAKRYNRRHYLKVALSFSPYPNAGLSYCF